MITVKVCIIDETMGLGHQAHCEVETEEPFDADEFTQRHIAPLAAAVFERWKQSLKEQI